MNSTVTVRVKLSLGFLILNFMLSIFAISIVNQGTRTMHVIEARDLSKQVTTTEGDLAILQGVDFTLNAGEVVAIVGPSGSGKSTLLALLAGLDSASGGQMDLLGESLHELDEDGRAAVRAGQVGFVFQSFQLLPGLTAIENVMLPLELAGVTDARERAAEQLRKVGLAERQHHLPSQLSGGEQQRVAVARAFVVEPKVLFADEPTGNLDRASGDMIVELMFSMRAERDCALVLVTHDQRLAERCDRVLTMDAGVLHGAAEAVQAGALQ
jgi:putative ABC transport system ATP-binding protein